MIMAERDGARADRDEAIQKADDGESEIRKLMEVIDQHKRRVGAAQKETNEATTRAERAAAGDLTEAAVDSPATHDTTEVERDDVWTAVDLPAEETMIEYTTVAQGATMTIDAELEIVKRERDAVNKRAEDIEARVQSLLEEANRYEKQAEDAEAEAVEATVKAEEAVETAKAELAEAEEAIKAAEAARAAAEAARAEHVATKAVKAEPTKFVESISWKSMGKLGNTVVSSLASAVGSIFGSAGSVGGAAVGGIGKAVIGGVGKVENTVNGDSQKFTVSLVVTGTLLVICLVLKEK